MRLAPGPARMPVEESWRPEKYYAYLGGPADSAIILENGPSPSPRPMGRDRGRAFYLFRLSTLIVEVMEKPATAYGPGRSEERRVLDIARIEKIEGDSPNTSVT